MALVAGGLLWQMKKGFDAQGEANSASALAALSAPVPDDGGLPNDHAKEILDKAKLADAIAYASAYMADTWDHLDEGSALLAIWASKRLTWEDLQALPETMPARYVKDPLAERGRRLCVSGWIVEIRAETDLAKRMISDHALPLIPPAPSDTAASVIGADLGFMPGDDAGAPVAVDDGGIGLPATPDGGVAVRGDASADLAAEDWSLPDAGKVFFAVVSTEKSADGSIRTAPDPDGGQPPIVYSLIAVHSTGKLVDGDAVKACGILTGQNSIASDSATVTSNRIVGMFDLPENHAAKVATAVSAIQRKK